MNHVVENTAPKRESNPGTGFALGGGIAILSITAATSIYPNYSVRNQAISFLGGNGVPTQIFWNSAVIIVGILWLWSTYLLFHNSSSKIRSIAFYPAGVGFLLVGTSPWNLFPITHYLGANLIFLFGSVSCLVAYRMMKGSLSKISLMSGLIPIAAYISGYFGSNALLGPGGIERMIFYPILLWQIAFGGYLISYFHYDGIFDGRRFTPT